MSRSVSVPQAMGLVFIGVILGAGLDALIIAPLHAAWPRQMQRVKVFTARQRDPVQFQKDSAAQAELVKRISAQRPLPPLEVRRVQAATNCAVSFEFRDSLFLEAKLFEVTAWDRLAPGTVVTRALSYREAGYGKGDTATVVLPNVYCKDILIASMERSVVPPYLISWAQ